MDPSFSPHPIDLHLVLAQEGRKGREGKTVGKEASCCERETSKRARTVEERGGRGGGRAISAVCMRGRRQTLLNCPMTPYIPFYPVRPPAHTLLRFRPAAASPRVVIPIPKKTDPASPAPREKRRGKQHAAPSIRIGTRRRGRGRITPEVDFDWRSAEKRSEK